MKGATLPRIETAPLRELTPETTLGFECIEFALHVLGIRLNPWQEHFVKRALELRPDGRLRFRHIILIVARQNGKSLVLIVLALYFMLVLKRGELVLGTAQDLDTSEGTWQDALDVVESIPALRRMLKGKPVKIKGAKSFTFGSGSRWLVRPSNRKGGRGKSASLVLMDELREQLNWDSWDAISNTTLARDEALVLGASNAGDARSVVLKTLRDKARTNLDDPDTTTLLCEWSAPEDADLDDREAWAQANPSVGYTLTWEALEAARETSTDNGWKTENLGIWVTALAQGPWADGLWEDLQDRTSTIAPDSRIVLAVDTALDLSQTYIGAVGRNAAGQVHAEIIAMRPGDAWVGPWLDRRWDAIGAAYVVVQGRGAPASALAEILEDRGIPVARCQGSDLTAAHMGFYEAVRDGEVVHVGQPPLDLAAEHAAIKSAGDGVWMWDRRRSAKDCAPLVAVSMAHRALTVGLETTKPAVSAYDDPDRDDFLMVG